MKINKIVSLAGLLLLALMTGCTDKTPPGEEEIDNCIAIVNRLDSLTRVKEISREEANSRIEAEISVLDMDYMTLDQISRLAGGGMLYKYNSLRKCCQPSFKELVKDKSITGAKAAALYTINFPSHGEDGDDFEDKLLWVEAYRAMVKHPAIGELMLSSDRIASTVFGRLQFLDPEAVGRSGLIEEMMPLLSYPMSVDCAASAVTFFDVASNPLTACNKELIQEIRKKVLDKTIETHDNLLESASADKKRTDHLKHIIAYLSGASSRGELIGFQSPEIHFDKCTIDGIETLSELKGKVVLVDFWATWCGPCVGSFPNIRALSERYSDYPVTIIGVTSLQGSHTDRVNNKRINTKGNPELEYSLMDQFIGDMDITWEIAFSAESNFNEDFGVRGIPHVAIIDPSGVVRYNRLRPYEAPWHEAEKIDKLLHEAGLDYPSDPMDKINYAESGH